MRGDLGERDAIGPLVQACERSIGSAPQARIRTRTLLEAVPDEGGHQVSSGVLRCPQPSAAVRSSHQSHSSAYDRLHVIVIRRHQASSGVIRRHQASSGVIRRHQSSAYDRLHVIPPSSERLIVSISRRSDDGLQKKRMPGPALPSGGGTQSIEP